MPGYTRLLLTGRSLHAVGAVTDLARDLAPAAVVLEDVDLVAEDRWFGPGSSPVLFDLLDAMDGAAGDADLLLLLTTNRADLLEPALAARPGRVDVAVAIAIDRPDDQDLGAAVIEDVADLGALELVVDPGDVEADTLRGPVRLVVAGCSPAAQRSCRRGATPVCAAVARAESTAPRAGPT